MRHAGIDRRLAVTTIAKRPDLLPVVTEWLWREWWQPTGRSLQQTQAIYAECCTEVGASQTFILLAGATPVGTATMAQRAVESRPDLTPWLAEVFVVPDARGQGYVRHLLAAFDEACQAASIPTAWLSTNTAERVYVRGGWKVVEISQRQDKTPITLMRRDLPTETFVRVDALSL